MIVDVFKQHVGCVKRGVIVKSYLTIFMSIVMFAMECFFPFTTCAYGVHRFDNGYKSLADDGYTKYIESGLYERLVEEMSSLSKTTGRQYYVENVQAMYFSKEYIQEMDFNAQENVYFGYKLSDVVKEFGNEKFIFAVDDKGKTVVKKFEKYDNTVDEVIKNVAVGTGVIVVCVTVSVVTGGLGAPAVSMIFMASAKGAAVGALSGAAISGIPAGIVRGYETGNFGEAIKAGTLAASKGFKVGAITGAITAGAGKAIKLYGATTNGLTMNEAAIIQRESKYPLDVVKQFKSFKQYDICRKAGLTPKMINGRSALVRDINWMRKDEFGLTNVDRVRRGLAPIDSKGFPYELHHIGQKPDSTLAILTRSEHRLEENYKIWHEIGRASEINRPEFDQIRREFWQALLNETAK